MDIETIYVFLKIAEHGSMMGVAEQLGYTPSALSHIIKRLEKDLGEQLLVRTSHGVKLTEAGISLLPKFRELISCEQSIRNEIASRRLNELTVGAYTSIASVYLPTVIAEFTKLHPNVIVKIRTIGLLDGYEILKSGKISFLFAEKEPSGDCAFIPMKRDYYYAVFAPDFDTGGRKSFSIKEFEKYTFIIPSFGVDYSVHKVFEKYSVKPLLHDTKADDEVVINLVSKGLAVSMLTEMVLKNNNVPVKTLPIEPAVYREIGLAAISFRKLSIIERDFVKIAESVLMTEVSQENER